MSLAEYALIDDANEVWDYLAARQDDRSIYSGAMESWINGCSLLLEKECNRNLKSRTYTDAAQDGTGKSWMYLDNYPIISIAAMQVNDADGVLAYTIDPVDDIIIQSETGKVILKPGNAPIGGFTKGRQNVLTTYNAGFSGNDLEFLKDAVKEMILIRWQERGGYPIDLVRSDNIGAGASDTKFDPRRLSHIIQRVVWMMRNVEV